MGQTESASTQSSRANHSTSLPQDRHPHGHLQPSNGTPTALPVFPSTVARDQAAVSVPGEEALYKQIGAVLDAAAKDPEVMKTLRETAYAADPELIAPMMQWRFNGQPAGNGWTSPANNGAFGTDYYHRTGAVKADPYDNKRNETMYFYTDNDTSLQQLVGESSYAVTLPGA
jgi:hypothetical protein